MNSVVQVWNIVTFKTPASIHSELKHSNTRSGDNGNLMICAAETALGRNSFMVRSLSMWNRVPVDIRNLKNQQAFKKKLKEWIKINIDIE